MKLFIISIFTLSVIIVLLFSIIALVFYLLDIVDFVTIFIVVGILFFLQWLLSPYISDLVFQWLYKLKWIGFEGLLEMDKEVAKFLEEICRKNKIKIPKIGFIDDDNPQAFCYGSAAFNARLVFTKGILTYLDTEERKAVFAHEIGHIVHRDFIIMTLAAFFLSLLYHISQALFKIGRLTNRRNRKGYIFIGVLAYIFYLIGTYILLFLSRIREYYADEFSVKSIKSSDPLARALIKIAYGIIARPEEKKQQELMKGTRVLGIMDFNAAKGIGLSYISCLKLKSWEPLQKVFLFDLKNPWAFIYELNSSHPLVAKRIKRLEKFYDVTVFDFDKIEKFPIDSNRLYANFFKDIFFEFLPVILPLSILIIIILFLNFKIFILPTESFYTKKIIFSLFPFLFLTCFGVAIILKTLYRYRKLPPEKTTVMNMLEDVYASPIRGKPVEVEGKIVGRGIPGLILSEDMLLQDETGLIYLNYEGLIPFLSNIIFSLFKLEKLIGKNVKAYGWFLRGLTPRIELEKIIVDGKEIKSWIRFWLVFIGMFIIVIGIANMILLFIF